MNYNAHSGGRPSLGRKVKRVSDVNAMGMGYNNVPFDPNQAPQNVYPNLVDEPPQNMYPAVDIGAQQFAPPGVPVAPAPAAYYPPAPAYGAKMVPPGAAAGGVFGQPIVQDMAMQYGQQLANSGTNYLKNEVSKFVPVTTIKYYFAVDTKYVVSKLALLFFPFTHSDWSVKYDQNTPVQPRFEINAPDLYIPSMAFVTYILVAGVLLGMQQRFSHESIGILASTALAWTFIELVIYTCTLYIANIVTSLRTLDLLAYSGYKFVGIIVSTMLSVIGSKTYYASLLYTNLCLAFFLVRSLKAQVLAEQSPQSNTYYGGEISGNKRRLYFLFLVAAMQPFMSWWLSFHFISGEPIAIPNVNK